MRCELSTVGGFQEVSLSLSDKAAAEGATTGATLTRIKREEAAAGDNKVCVDLRLKNTQECVFFFCARETRGRLSRLSRLSRLLLSPKHCLRSRVGRRRTVGLMASLNRGKKTLNFLLTVLGEGRRRQQVL